METTQLEKQTTAIAEYTAKLVISTPSQQTAAGEALRRIKLVQKEVAAHFDGPVKAAYDSWKAATALRAKFDEPLKDAERRIKNELARYQAVQEAEARRQQLEAEAKARAEAEAERKALEKQAVKADKKGDADKAEALRQEATFVQAAPVVVAGPAKQDGIAYRDEWYAEVVDLGALPREYLLPNTTALNALAKATKGTVRISGVEFKSRKVVSARSGK